MERARSEGNELSTRRARGGPPCGVRRGGADGAGDGLGRAGAVIVYRRSTAGSEGAMRLGRALERACSGGNELSTRRARVGLIGVRRRFGGGEDGAGDGGGRAGAVIVYWRSTAGSEGAMRLGRAWSVHAPEEMS